MRQAERAVAPRSGTAQPRRSVARSRVRITSSTPPPTAIGARLATLAEDGAEVDDTPVRALLSALAALAVASGGFTSARYGYRLQLPRAWGAPTVEPGGWQPGTFPHTNDPGTDTWTDGRGRYFVVVAKPI